MTTHQLLLHSPTHRKSIQMFSRLLKYIAEIHYDRSILLRKILLWVLSHCRLLLSLVMSGSFTRVRRVFGPSAQPG